MTIQELRDEDIEIGFRRGHAEGRAEMIRNLLYEIRNAGMTAKMLKVDPAEVWSIVKAERIPVDDYPN